MTALNHLSLCNLHVLAEGARRLRRRLLLALQTTPTKEDRLYNGGPASLAGSMECSRTTPVVMAEALLLWWRLRVRVRGARGWRESPP